MFHADGLKKVYMDIEEPETVPGLPAYIRELEGRGTSVCLVGRRAVDSDRKVRADMPGDSLRDRAWPCVGVQAGGLQTTGQESESVLWLTDNADTAKRLTQEGKAGAAFLHAGNREEDFSCVRYAVEGFEDMEPDYLEKIYRRCRGLPWHILDTAGCTVRETTVADVDAFYRIYAQPGVTRYMEDLFADREEEIRYAQTYIEQVYGFYGYGMWTVEARGSGEVIGRAGLTLREGFEIPELGFVIAPSWQGRGLAYEVCGAILRYGREELGFSEVQALVQPENRVSLGLCRKLGFMDEGEVTVKAMAYRRMHKALA